MEDLKNRKYKGSVLLTVVSVMALLIIFLFGTLVLATSANNRAHVNYSSAQTKVTSRLVVDSAIKAMDINADYHNVIGAIKSGDTPTLVPVQISSDDTNINTATLGRVDDVEVSYAGTRKFYDTVKKEWIDRDLIRFTSNVTLGGVTSTTNAYVLKHMPEDNDSNDGGAGYVTTGGSSLPCQSSLYGGTYINIPSLEKVDKFDYDDPTTYRVIPLYSYSDKDKDDAVDDPGSVDKVGGTGKPAIVGLRNTGAVMEADAVINSNLLVKQWSGFIFPGPGTGITVWGDMAFYGAEGVANLVYENKCKVGEKYNFNEIPYVYVDGGIYGKSWDGDRNKKVEDKIRIGNPTKNASAATGPLNIFAGYVYARGSSQCDFYGNLFLMDADKTSVLTGSSTHLYKWSSSVINKAKSTEASANVSSICSNGNLELAECTIDGDVRVAGNCIIGKNVVINGNLVVGGKLTIKEGNPTINGGVVYCDNISAAVDTSSQYKTVETILHDAEEKTIDECVVVKNEERVPYYVWKAADHGNKDIEGNALYEDLYYMYTAEYDDSVDLNADGIDYTKYLQGGAKKYELPEWGAVTDYLVKSKIDPDTVEENDDGTYSFDTYPSYEPADTSETYYDISSLTEVDVEDATVYVPAFRAKVDYDGNELDPIEKTNEKYMYYTIAEPHTEVDEYTATHGSGDAVNGLTTKTFADFTNTYHEQAYPKYAEKKVILGLELVPNPADPTKTLSKSETQVVRTMKDVLNDVVNPYDTSELPNAFKIEYDNLIKNPGKTYKSVEAVKAGMKKTVSSVKMEGGKVKITTQNDVNGGLYINDSCVIDIPAATPNGAGVASPTGKKVMVIDPDGKDILIVIRHFDLDAGLDVFIDDSDGGRVNFYIEPKGEMRFRGNAIQTTTSWYEMLSSKRPFQAASDSTKIMKDSTGKPNPELVNDILGNNAKPIVYYYGARGSKLTWGNFIYCTANIVSPNIALSIDATTLEVTNNVDIYYNGFDTKEYETSPYLFGCCNSNKTYFKNMINELWINDGLGGKPPTPDGGDDFWYKVLYYDEY
ncbi:MAG: hypothetical protein MJ079_02160 [Ruminococcus sp.]|nr:hypothetical protein [Ruminococcus sp.]